MPTVYTLSNGVQLKLADGLTDDQVLAESKKLTDNPVFDTKNIEDTFDIRTGVQDKDLRFSLALADGNREETALVLNNKVGEGNWGYTDQGYLYVDPEGLARRGIQSNKPILVNGTDTTINDFIDVIPEATVGVAALGAEILLPMIPGSGAIFKGFLSPIVSRGLRASSFRAGVGDIAANMGLEEIQKDRGENIETLGTALSKAGTEGAIVAGASLALGLPFKLLGGVSGKIANTAKNKMGETTSDGIAVSAASAQQARANAVQELKATGKYSDAEIEKLVPVITIKHMLGDEGSLSGKFATILEGIGAKNIGDKLPADALVFLQKYDDMFRNAKLKGMGTPEIVDMMKASLTKSELDLLGKTQKNVDEFYTKVGAKAETDQEVSFLTGLIAENISKQFRFGQDKFKALYGELELDGLSNYQIGNAQVAQMIKDIGKAAGTTPDGAMSLIQRVDGNLANRINNVIKFKGTNRNPVARAKVKKETENRVNARDLYQLGQALRRQAGTEGSDFSKLRKTLKTDEVVTKVIDNKVGKNFGTKFAEVQSKYAKFIQPYTNRIGVLEKTTKQNAEDYVKQLVTGAKSGTFSDVVENLDLILKGTDDIGGKAFDVLDADALLGKVGTQYMRYAKDKYGLTNIDLVPENIPVLRDRAKQALKALDDLENRGEFTARHKKAFRRIFNDEGFDEYKKALRQISEGKPEGLGKLQQALSYKEAESFISRIATLGDNLSGSGKLTESLAEFRRYKEVDPRGAEFYSDLLYSQIYSRLLKIGGLDATAKNTGIKAWGQDIVSANNTNKEALEELLGANYKPIMDMGNIIQGAFNIDPTAGAISAAGMPISTIRGALNLSVVGALKPISLMYTLKSFAPGKPGWNKISQLSKKGLPQDEIEKQVKPLMSKLIKGGKNTASLTMAGRNGLLAGTVSGYLDEADEGLPPENTPNVKRQQVDEEEIQMSMQQQSQPQPVDMANIQQQFGANMLNLLNASQQYAGLGQKGLAEGQAIAKRFS